MLDFDIISDARESSALPQPQQPFRRLALIGNALPRKCGLATYTSHVAEALRTRYPAMAVDHYALDDGSGVAYSPEIATIAAESPDSYRAAAERIAASGAEAIWLQHEFGIFGGLAGSHILELVGATDLPLIVTLHTVLERPSADQGAVMRRLIDRADRLIVMASSGVDILKRHYRVPGERIRVIPHGVPDRPLRDPEELKAAAGWQGRKVLMTFGLLAPDKGIRHMIEAMPQIVREHPDALYEVVGATHPNLVRQEGERHRQMLVDLARELGVADHVRFVDRFVEQDELLDLLQAADIYVTPYLNMAQITSGTLSYAVAVGKPVIATPYVHAREILADGTGLLVSPASTELAEAAIGLLGDPERRRALAEAAYRRGRTMLWPRVVEQSLARLPERARQPRVAASLPVPTSLPLTAIERMTDSAGLIQHAVLSIPDRRHGYCIDDNARALMMAVRRGDSRSAELATVYAAFVQHGWNPEERRFRNFMAYDRSWLEQVGSEDSNGRTLWALALTAARSRWPDLREWAARLFDEVAPIAADFTAPRARAFAALAGHELLRRDAGHEGALGLLSRCAEQLTAMHEQHARPDWNWFEPCLAYDNARLPEALIRAGQGLGDPAMRELGIAALAWLTKQQTAPRGHFRPVGCKSFGRPYAPPLAFDQQALEATATVDCAAAAFETTGDPRWSQVARDAFGWFFGDNDAGVPIADAMTGSCHDGLMATGINRNQGAESILSVHLASQTMREVFGSGNRTGQERVVAAEAETLAAS